MTTTELLMIKVETLTELELDDFLIKIGEHLSKNNLEHLINNAFDMDGGADRIAELENDLETAEDKIYNLEQEVDELNEKIEKLEGQSPKQKTA